jgi:cholesterol oxidase
MGRDVPDGNARLTSDGYLDVDWQRERSDEFFNALRHTGRQMSDQLRATFLDNLPWYIGRSTTVHPLGGCPMGRNENEGVADSYGRVFGYPGLYIADGSIMPGPVGPNPSTTIAAISHRIAEQLIAEAG